MPAYQFFNPRLYSRFRDMFSLLRDPVYLKDVSDLMLKKVEDSGWRDIDVVVGLESRGFVLGPLVALKLGAGFVPIRKKGRLPGKCRQVSYSLEYGNVSTLSSSYIYWYNKINVSHQDVLEMQEESISPGQRVLVVDDLIATGGSLAATCKLLKDANACIVGCLVLLRLEELQGEKNVGVPLESLISF